MRQCAIAFCILIGIGSIAATSSSRAEDQQVKDVIVVGPDTKLGADAGKEIVKGTSKDVLQDWKEFLSSHGLHEGLNPSQTADQSSFYIVMGRAEVKASPQDPNWLYAHGDAYQQAILGAKQSFAESLKADVKSDRLNTIFHNVGQGVPEIGDKVAEKLSVIDKMRTLTDKSLDAEIKNYDPSWDGTGKTETDRQRRVVTLRNQYEEQIAASASAFAVGAMPIFEAEGSGQDNYQVLVGMVISENMRKIARAITDNTIQLSLLPPEDPVVKQIDDLYTKNPAFITATEGVRIYTDEHGARVLVCFAGVPEIGDSMVSEGEAKLLCQGRIAQFVGETIVVAKTGDGGVINDVLAPQGNSPDPESRTSFNKKFEFKVRATTGIISMSGLSQIGHYETRHPYTHQRMLVGAYLWSQALSNQAQQLRSQNSPGTTRTPVTLGTNGQAPVNRGVTTNPSKF